MKLSELKIIKDEAICSWLKLTFDITFVLNIKWETRKTKSVSSCYGLDTVSKVIIPALFSRADQMRSYRFESCSSAPAKSDCLRKKINRFWLRAIQQTEATEFFQALLLELEIARGCAVGLAELVWGEVVSACGVLQIFVEFPHKIFITCRGIRNSGIRRERYFLLRLLVLNVRSR